MSFPLSVKLLFSKSKYLKVLFFLSAFAKNDAAFGPKKFPSNSNLRNL